MAYRMKWLGWVVLAMVVTTLSGCSDDAVMQPAVSKISEQADALLRAGKNEEALCRLRMAAELAPNTFQPHYNLGVSLNKLDHWQEAVEPLEKAHGMKPESADVLFTMGINYQSLGDSFWQLMNSTAVSKPIKAKPEAEVEDMEGDPPANPPPSVSPSLAKEKALECYQKALKAYNSFLKVATEQDPARADVRGQLELLNQRIMQLSTP